jgi:hypothetical protein
MARLTKPLTKDDYLKPGNGTGAEPVTDEEALKISPLLENLRKKREAERAAQLPSAEGPQRRDQS